MNHEDDGAAWSVQVWRRIKLSALCLGGVMAAGIVGLMILAAGKDEDIAGIIAPALLITLLSAVITGVAALRQRRAENRR